MFAKSRKTSKPKVVEWEADEFTTGPASLMLTDPDGNPILIDQHVDSSPKRKKA